MRRLRKWLKIWSCKPPSSWTPAPSTLKVWFIRPLNGGVKFFNFVKILRDHTQDQVFSFLLRLQTHSIFQQEQYLDLETKFPGKEMFVIIALLNLGSWFFLESCTLSLPCTLSLVPCPLIGLHLLFPTRFLQRRIFFFLKKIAFNGCAGRSGL